MASTDPAGRTDPPLRGDEASTLRAFLTFQRDTFRWKVEGLSREQLARTHPPSTMTLAGMAKHLAVVESGWLEETFAGRPLMPPFDAVDWDAGRDWEWHTAAADSPEQLRALLEEAVRRADEIIELALATEDGLDSRSVGESRRGEGRFSLRWILVHLIEEYARHNGHADLIREAIDGATGE